MSSRLQIALEFMMVFAFVVVIFLVLFATISAQRALALNSQIFAQLQTVAQNIVMQLNRAVASGDGYTAKLPIIGTAGNLNYNITLSNTGAVMVQAKLGSQVIQAIAYSQARNIISGSAYQSKSGYYTLPISSGTISIQNSLGSICVDYLCENPGLQAESISLYSKSVYVPVFNGHSYINAGNSQALMPSSITVAGWVYLSSNTPWMMVDKATGGTSGSYYIYGDCLTGCGGSPEFSIYGPTGSRFNVPFGSLTTSKWYFLVGTFNASSGIEETYLNGEERGFLSGASLGSNNANLLIATYASGSYSMNGSLANIQIYNVSLSSNQILSLYNEGIGGAPVSTNNLVGWWPLNGNANDYSGNNNNGNVNGALVYRSVSEISANVSGYGGSPVQGALVGFTTSLGSFSTGSSTISFTNINGTARAFLNQNGTSGQAFITATAFNGNSSTEPFLDWWWPMNQGVGNISSSIGAISSQGIIYNASWAGPAFRARFSGNGWITVPNSTAFNFSSGDFAISAWVKTSSNSSDNEIVAKGGSCSVSGYKLITYNGQLRGSINNAGANPYYTVVSPQQINNGQWHFVVFQVENLTASNMYLSLYIDGGLANVSGPFSTTSWAPLTSDHFGIGSSDAVNPVTCPNFFNGSIANVQVYKGALTKSQILKMYLNGISSPPSSSNLVGWWPLDGNANDYSYHGNYGSIYGNVQFTEPAMPQQRYFNSTSILAGTFNGYNSIINIPSTLQLPNGNAPGTICAYGKPYAYPGTYSSNDGWSWLFSYGTGNSGNARFIGFSSSLPYGIDFGSYGHDVIASYQYPLNQWLFICGTYNSTNATLYVNGEMLKSEKLAFDTIPSQIRIGDQVNPLSEYFNGQIADVQVYNESLTSAEISTLYGEGIDGVPILGAGLLSWWPLNGNTADFVNNGAMGTPTSVSYTEAHSVETYGALRSLNGYGINFNGQNSYIGVQGSSQNEFTNYTIAMWVNTKNTSNEQFFFNANTVTGIMALGTQNNGKLCIDVDGSCQSIAASIPKSAWYFYAVRVNGTKLSTFLNNAEVSSLTTSAPIITGAKYLGTFTSGSLVSNASIADVQIYGQSLTNSQIYSLYQANLPPKASITVPLSWES